MVKGLGMSAKENPIHVHGCATNGAVLARANARLRLMSVCLVAVFVVATLMVLGGGIGSGASPTAGATQTPAPTATPAATPTPAVTPDLAATATAAAIRAAIEKSKNDELNNSWSRVTVVTGIVKNVFLDLGSIIVAAFVVALLIGSRSRIWDAMQSGALTLNAGPFGSISIPARAAALQQTAQAPLPAPSSLPPPTPALVAPVGVPAVPSAEQLAAAAHLQAVVRMTPDSGALVSKIAESRHLIAPLTTMATGAWSNDAIQFYRRFYGSLLASQFKVLAELDSGSSLSVADAKVRYDEANAAATRLSFANWLKYLTRYGMISELDPRDQRASLVLTSRGRDFLGWAAANHLGAQELTEEGRDY